MPINFQKYGENASQVCDCATATPQSNNVCAAGSPLASEKNKIKRAPYQVLTFKTSTNPLKFCICGKFLLRPSSTKQTRLHQIIWPQCLAMSDFYMDKCSPPAAYFGFLTLLKVGLRTLHLGTPRTGASVIVGVLTMTRK